LFLKDAERHCKDSRILLANPFTGHQFHIHSPCNRHCRFILAVSSAEQQFVIAFSTTSPYLQFYRHGGDRDCEWIITDYAIEWNLVTWLLVPGFIEFSCFRWTIFFHGSIARLKIKSFEDGMREGEQLRQSRSNQAERIGIILCFSPVSTIHPLSLCSFNSCSVL